MTRSGLLVGMSVCLALAGSIALGMLMEDREQSISEQQLPAAVLAAIRQHKAIDRLIEVDRVSQQGQIVYEIELVSGGRVYDFEIRADGALLEMTDEGSFEQPGEAEDEHVEVSECTLEAMPAEAIAAYLRTSGGVKPTLVQRLTDHGVESFEIEFERIGVTTTVVFSSTGECIALETQVDAATLPQAVRDALLRRYPDATIGKAESIQQFSFEVELKVGDRFFDVVILPNGRIDDDDDDCDDDDADDELDDD